MRDKILLFFIFFLAIFFRFNNLNWDSGFHLHPDERFLTMVGNAMTVPVSFKNYLDPSASTFNPANVGFKFYVYGVFPIVLNKIIAVLAGNDNYNSFTIQGRFLSAFFDILTLVFVYKIAQLLISKKTKFALTGFNLFPLISAFFYAIAVFPIQLSHFFATDTFLNFFMLGSFYFVFKLKEPPRFQEPRGFLPLVYSAVFFGLALSTKVSAIYILPLNFILILLTVFKKKNNFLKNFYIFIFISALYLLISYIILRLANPYYFQSASFFNPTLNGEFTSSIKQLQVLSTPEGSAYYPPAVQWQTKGPLFLLINTAVFGLGIAYFVLLVIGIIALTKKQFLILLWVLVIFFFQSFQFVKTMRYTIYLYPFFAIFAAIGLLFLILNLKNWNLFRTSNLGFRIFLFLIVLLLLIWPLMFSSIYFHKNSRVEASEWIYKNLPNNSYILSEHWDDGLPLPISKNRGKIFRSEQIAIFDPDTPEKWQKITKALKNADYYILSSNRGWGSIPTVPTRYPITTKFYADLFAGKINYKLVKEFHSYPKLEIGNWKFEFNDQWSEELFTVYDHQKVLVFKRTRLL